MTERPATKPHFTVESNGNYGRRNSGTSSWLIRYDPTPGGKVKPDGSRSFGMNFPVLVATDFLADPEPTLQKVADILNKHWEA
jgi:hypothetical protein